jgi:hydrogenase maturation protease
MTPAFPVRCICWTWNLSTKAAGSEAGSEWHVVGLGTSLSSDDEIGLALVQALSLDTELSGYCILLESADAATVASSLLEWRQSVILVDAADMGLNPGEFRFFADKDASMVLKTSSVSTHGLGLAEGLEIARALGFDRSVNIFGVQPFDLSPRQGMTQEMTNRFTSLLEALKHAWMQCNKKDKKT